MKAPGQAGASGSLAAPEAPGDIGRPDDHAFQTPGGPVSLAGVHRARPDQTPGRAGRAEPSSAGAPGPTTTAPGSTTTPGSGPTSRFRETEDAAAGRFAGSRFSFLARHSVFGVLLLVGVALRLAAVIGYRPAFEFSGDSYAYIRLSELSEPDPMRPAGYPAFLRVLVEAGADLWVVPVVQHLLGLLLAAALYALLVHRRVVAPIAAIAAAPLLLDAYQVVIEHFVMAETVFAMLLVAAIVALMWSRRPSVWALALAGLLLGASGLVRTIGVAIGLLAFGYVVARRLGWLRVSVFGVFLVAPLVAYAAWFNSAHGSVRLTGGDAAWLYGRVAPIADCTRLDLRPEQLALCSPHPVGERPDPSYYVWDRNSPANRLGVSAAEREELLRDFAQQVIIAQPADYLAMVGRDIAHVFRPGRPVGPQDWPDATWRFPTDNEPRYLHNSEPLLGLHGESDRPGRTTVEPWAGILRSYQTRGYTPGPALAAAAGLGLLAALAALPRIVPAGLRGGDGRARWHDLTAERRRTGLDCLFLVAAGTAVIAIPAATVCFDYRYMLPMLFLLPPAAALATRQGQLVVLAWRERRTATETPWRTSASATPDAPFRLADPFPAFPPADGPAANGPRTDTPGTDGPRTDGPRAAAAVGRRPRAGSVAQPGVFEADPPTIPGEPVDDAPTGAQAPPTGPTSLPKRPPGVTYEARERRRRAPGDATSEPERPTTPVPARPARRPVSLGPDARMPTPDARTPTPIPRTPTSTARPARPTRPTRPGGGTASAGPRRPPAGGTGSTAGGTGGTGTAGPSSTRGGQPNPPRGGQARDGQDDWDHPTMPPQEGGNAPPTDGRTGSG